MTIESREPTLEHPASQLCTYNQFLEPHFIRIASSLGFDPAVLHRKNWEWCYIIRAIEACGLMRPGNRALTFGCGTEPIPSYLAANELRVTATDAPAGIDNQQGWSSSLQYAGSVYDLYRRDIVGRGTFNKNVTFRSVDMRDIPRDLRGFDFLWSSCSLEHIGGLRAGLDFIVEAMNCIKPGGYAIHTTEFNLSSDSDTFETPGLSLYRQRDIDDLADRLRSLGHMVAALNYSPGSSEIDAHIDLPPYSLPHLKLKIADYASTSIGIIIKKAN